MGRFCLPSSLSLPPNIFLPLTHSTCCALCTLVVGCIGTIAMRGAQLLRFLIIIISLFPPFDFIFKAGFKVLETDHSCVAKLFIIFMTSGKQDCCESTERQVILSTSSSQLPNFQKVMTRLPTRTRHPFIVT